MSYTKKDAIMTKGFAILCMLMLHLFCRKGTDVFGTPLIWINESTPFVYIFGYFSQICVSIYSLSAGYAQFFLLIKKNNTYVSNLRRIIKLLINYWIILSIFSVIAIIIGSESNMDVNFISFTKNFFLLESYNGAWWFLHSYLFILLIPPKILLSIPQKLSPMIGICLFILFYFLWGLVKHSQLLTGLENIQNPVISYVVNETENILKILPSFFIGAFLCKGRTIEKIGSFLIKIIKSKICRKIVIVCLFLFVVVIDFILHISIFTIIIALFVFILFNLLEKSILVQNIFLFLGKHSTNIWLSHMFFYAYVFVNLIFIVKYPILILLFLLLLCLITSFVVFWIQKLLKAGIYRIKRGKNEN